MGRETVIIEDGIAPTPSLRIGDDGVIDTEMIMTMTMDHGHAGGSDTGMRMRVTVSIRGGTGRRGIGSKTFLWRTSLLSWIERCVRFKCII
jgi:hypothetical protein